MTAAGFGGWIACDLVKADQMTDLQSRLQQNMLAYNAESIRAQKAEADRVIAAIVTTSAERAAMDNTVQTIIREVERAPETDTCATSPAIVAALDGLRELTARPGGPASEPAP